MYVFKTLNKLISAPLEYQKKICIFKRSKNKFLSDRVVAYTYPLSEEKAVYIYFIFRKVSVGR